MNQQPGCFRSLSAVDRENNIKDKKEHNMIQCSVDQIVNRQLILIEWDRQAHV